MRTLACLACIVGISNAWGAFRCVDVNGVTQIGDVPPPACANVTTYEVSRSGAVIRRIDPPALPQGIQDQANRRDSDRMAAETKRRDRALLDSYTSAREIELARDRSLEIIKSRAEAAGAQAKQLELRERELERSIAAQGKRDIPPQLRADLASVRAERMAAAATQARFEKDFEATRAKFELDKKRWIELKEVR